MKYIKSTDLRYKTSAIVSQLREGQGFYLIHRSEVVGELMPKQEEKKAVKSFDPVAFGKILDGLRPVPKLSDKERKRRYREHLEKKYGKRVS